jgi:hypothetical protein
VLAVTEPVVLHRILCGTAIGHDHGYDGEIFYLDLALDEKYVEGSLGQVGEDDPREEEVLG